MSRRAGSATLAALVALAALAAGPAGGGSGLRGQVTADRELVSLGFRGNRAFSDAELAAAIEMEATRCRTFLLQPVCALTNWGFAHDRGFLEERQLALDVLRLQVFYSRRGYRQVRVDTAVERRDGTARVRVTLEEGEPTRVDSFSLEGVEGILDTAAVRRDIGLRPGDPFDRVRLEAGKQLLRERLQNRGYVNAVVLEESFIPTGAGARVTLSVDPGPRIRVGRILVEGAPSIGARVVRQFLTFRSGEYYSQERVLESQRNLFSLEMVRFASIGLAASPAPEDTVVDVRVQVTEASTRAARVGGGVSTTQCVTVEGRLTHRNVFGSARRLQLTGQLSNLLARDLDRTFPCTDVGEDSVFQQLNFRLRADFQQPYFLSSRTSLRAAAFMERESVPDIFVRRSDGAELAVTHRLRPRMSLTLAYRPEFTGFDERSADIFFCVNFGFCTPQDIDVLTERRWLAPLVLTWRYDRTNSPFQPTRGYYATAELERAEAATGSDYRYIRLALEAASFKELSGGWVLASRFRSGVVEATRGLVFDVDPEGAEDVIHPRKRFFAGGAQSVRGFGQNLLGPRALVVDSARQCAEVSLQTCASDLARTNPGAFGQRPSGGNAAFEASLELRRSMGGGWGWVGFVDVGQVWEDLSAVRAPVATPGMGIRYRTPVGPLRVDIGYDPSGTSRLPVLAELPGGEIRELEARVAFDPFTFDDPSTVREFFRRLKLQLAIGEAF